MSKEKKIREKKKPLFIEAQPGLLRQGVYGGKPGIMPGIAVFQPWIPKAHNQVHLFSPSFLPTG